MKAILIAIFLLTIHSFSWAGYSTSPDATSTDSASPDATSSAVANFTYTDLEKILIEKDPKSIDELLSYLPESYRSGYTLFYDSRSLQFGSRLNPRVIMFGQTAELVISFNCDPKDCTEKPIAKYAGGHLQAGFDRIEIMRWVADEKRFEFLERRFTGDQPKIDEILAINQKTKIFKPKVCLGCHRGPDPRPQWDPYNGWFGAFASKDDYLLGDEKTAMEKFSENYKNRLRYRWLEDVAGHLYPGPSYTYKDNDGENVTIESDRIKTEPNSMLTNLLSILNMQRIVRKLQQHPNYDDLKYLLLNTAAAYKKEKEEIIISVRSDGTVTYQNELAGFALSQISASIPTKQALKNFLSCDTKDMIHNVGRLFVPNDAEIARTSLDFFTEALMGFGYMTSDWSMAIDYTRANTIHSEAFLSPASGLFTDPYGIEGIFIATLILSDKELKAAYGKLVEFSKYYDYGVRSRPAATINFNKLNPKLLDEWAALSSKKLTTLFQKIPEEQVFMNCQEREKKFNPKVALQVCISCHRDGKVGQQINFNDPRGLKLIADRISEIPKSGARMPLSGKMNFMTEAEQKAFLEYLKISAKP